MSNRVPARAVRAIGAPAIGRIPVDASLAFSDRSSHCVAFSVAPSVQVTLLPLLITAGTM